jgi:hypothetical protein
MQSESEIPELENLTLRVLEEYDEERKIYVARCLETGTVADAPDQESLLQAIQQTLQLEIVLAVKNSNFANLFRQPSTGDVWARWHRAAGVPGAVKHLTLKLDISLPTIPRREVKSEIPITQAKYPRPA